MISTFKILVARMLDIVGIRAALVVSFSGNVLTPPYIGKFSKR